MSILRSPCYSSLFHEINHCFSFLLFTTQKPKTVILNLITRITHYIPPFQLSMALVLNSQIPLNVFTYPSLMDITSRHRVAPFGFFPSRRYNLLNLLDEHNLPQKVNLSTHKYRNTLNLSLTASTDLFSVIRKISFYSDH